MSENAMQRRINFMAKYGVIKKEFFKMVEEAFATNSNYINLSNQATVGNELYCEFESGRYRISVRLLLMSVNIYVWVYDLQTGRDRMFSFDNPSDQFKKTEAKRSKMATENLKERFLTQLQNASTNDELLNAEPAFEYYFKDGREENIYTVYEYAQKINERFNENLPLI
jgi:hypothetical protein